MPVIDFSDQIFQTHFPDYGFTVRHDLINEPLLELDQLASLVDRLPVDSVEHNTADLAVSQDPATVSLSGYSAKDAIAQVDTANTWLVLKNVEQDKTYRELMQTTLEPVIAHARKKVSGIKEYEAFIFISSPNSVTPFHIDPEHNFLLQVRGEKTVYQWARDDRETLDAETVEELVFTEKHRNIDYHDQFASRQTTHHLKPGDGLYFPVRAPHWVKNGDQPSISFSITFRSSQSEREFRLYRRNGQLRALGRATLPVHKYPLIDLMRDTFLRSANKLTPKP